MASSMNIMGTYSGITMETVEQLISAESGKLTKFTGEQTSLKAEQSAWKDVQTRLTNLTDKMNALTKPAAFDAKKVKLSQEGKFTLSASPAALSGDFSIEVKQLATRTQVIGNKLELAEDTKLSSAWGKAGDLKIGIAGKDAQTITISETDSIESVIDRINESTKESGVSAVIIDNHVVLQSADLGNKKINIGGTVASDLGLDIVGSNNITHMRGNKLELAEDTKLTSAWGKAGDLTIGISGKEAQTLPISEKDSIKSVIDRINESTKESGVSAVIIDNHVVLQIEDLGDKTITIGGTLANDLGLANLKPNQVTQGKQASVIVNGIAITRDTNTISDIMEGVTLTLQATTTEAVTAKVTDDLEASTKLVQDFVDQYNSTMTFISTQLDVGDPSQENNKTGALAGDGSIMRLQSQLRGLLTQPVANGNAGNNTATAIGISVDRSGKATLDKSKLETALKENSKIVSDLFNYTVETTSEAADGTTVTKKDEVGMAQKFSTLLNSFTDSKEGIIATKNETYDKMIKDLDKRITVFNERLDAKRERYIKQFTALDIAMMEAESQINYLMSQVSSSNGNNK
ncbi:flagellar filament capping protein FliD [Jeotgalibaca porci]|uniref:Flagellar hook-associated protein 2 n=1 Tax=Jeotgalibaca porci TaxID=1868793 RepID=A0A6G7WH95_9LACT|nr:flagellar filament capping protein FliD [Jeotgalibaca porci]QIK51622.1 flagellar filament capping protein FliD [Jeotgalibaca porci]